MTPPRAFVLARLSLLLVEASSHAKGMSSSPIVSSETFEPPQLDHIIHLVQSGKLKESIAAYKKLGFNVERGGVHADGLTQNALVVLADGVYIELIEFLERPIQDENTAASHETLAQWRERRSQHWWWGKKQGWIDWCLKGGVKDGRVASINASSKLAVERSEADKEKNLEAKPDLVQYGEAASGGRKTLSGKAIEWKVTFPKGFRGKVRGMYPFWCEDVTPRDWRVPQPTAQHPNLTQGLAALTLLYHPETFPSRLASLQLILLSSLGSADDILASLIDMEPPPTTEGQSALPTEPVELYLSTPEGPPLPLRVKAAEDPDELQWLQQYGEGLWEVEISVASDKLPPTAPPDGIERDTCALRYGRLRLHPIHGVSSALSQGRLA